MSDSNGPVMLAATQVMRPGRTRIGKLGGNVTLPRTVSLVSLIAGGVGFLLGAVFGLTLGGGSLTGLMYGGTFGAAAGVFVVTYSPMKGESMLTWFGLTVTSRRRQVKVDGKPVTLFVGVQPIARPPAGPVAIVRGATRIPPSQFDERGVQLSAGNRNLNLAVDLGIDAAADAVTGDEGPAAGPGRRTRARLGRRAAPGAAPTPADAPSGEPLLSGRAARPASPASPRAARPRGDRLPTDRRTARLGAGGAGRKAGRHASAERTPAPPGGGDQLVQLPRPRRLKD